MLDHGWALSCTGPVCTTQLLSSWCASAVKSWRQRFTAFLPILLFPMMLPEPCRGRRGIYMYVLFEAEHSQTVTHLNQLWISTLNTTFCRNELLQPRLRVALTAGYKHRYLEGRFTACLFSKATVIDSPLRAHGLHEFSLKGKLVKILLSLVKR